MPHRIMPERSWGYGRSRVLDAVPSIRPLKNTKFCVRIQRKTSRNRQTWHPSNPLLSPEQCDDLCDSVRLRYATWSVFFSAKMVPAHSIRWQTHIRINEPHPSPQKRQTLRDTNQCIIQIIRRHPQICDELDRESTRFVIWKKHSDKYEDAAVHCCPVSATISPWQAAPLLAWAVAPLPAWPAAPCPAWPAMVLPSWSVAPPDILQSRKTDDAHVSTY